MDKIEQSFNEVFSEERLSRAEGYMPKDSYVCRHCGYVLPKKDAIISGYDSQPSLRHIHCSKCGKIITHTS